MNAVWWGAAGWVLLIAVGLLIGWRVSSYRKRMDAREAARWGLESADMWWAR